jgi:hypothetical protein
MATLSDLLVRAILILLPETPPPGGFYCCNCIVLVRPASAIIHHMSVGELSVRLLIPSYCRSMLDGSKHKHRVESRAMGWNVDKESGIQECRLVIACNKADLLPTQASQGRLEVSSLCCKSSPLNCKDISPRQPVFSMQKKKPFF